MYQSETNTATTADENEENLVQPYELVRMYLDIGQCRFIHALLSEKFKSDKAKGLIDKNDALGQLLHRFKNEAYPSVSKPFHKDESFDAYIDAQDTEDLGKLCAYIYVDGVLHVEQ